MYKINLFIMFLLASVGLSAQFVNNGATVTVQAGATLRVETDIQNNGAGTITNNGTIEVSGNFTNAGTATLTPGAGLIKFVTATGSPANANLDAGGDALNNVEMAKTSNQTVTQTSATSMGGNLSFTGAGSKMILGNFDFTMTNAAGTVTATTSHPTNGYVVTGGTGRFVKSLTASATVVHQIGDATNYTPVSNAVTASGAGTVGARVYTTGLQAKYADATDYINREWNVVSTGGVTANTMTGTYVAGDATGTASLIKGCSYPNPGTDWSFAGSAGAANQVTASTTAADTKLSGQNFFGKVNLKAFLQGAYSGGVMTTTLNTNNLIPLTSPYADAPATVTSIPANVTDWVRLELRDPSAPSTPTTNKASAFIKNDGTIVGLDGTSLPRIKNGFPISVVVLSHRNHLPIRTVNAGLDVVNPTLHNFTSGVGQAYDNNGITTNESMKDESGTFVMWSGDINQDGIIKYNLSNNDRALIYVAIGGGSVNATVTGYYNEDINLDSIVKYNLSNNDRALIYQNIGGASVNATLSAHN